MSLWTHQVLTSGVYCHLFAHSLHSGNIYIGDTHNNRVRKVTLATGIISTIAGTGTNSYGGDGGAATSAVLNKPTGVALDTAGAAQLFTSNLLSHRIH